MFALNSAKPALSLVPSTSANVDEIDVHELLKLKSEIDAFVDAQDAAERAFCEGDSAYQECLAISTEKALTLKHRIRGLAIATGVHADFLTEYASLSKPVALVGAEPF